jgi:hypothetical protein
MTDEHDTLAALWVYERPPADKQQGYTERELEARQEAMQTLADYASQQLQATRKRIIIDLRASWLSDVRSDAAEPKALLAEITEAVDNGREAEDTYLELTPSAIRDHFAGTTSNEAELARVASDAQLREVGKWCAASDPLLTAFHTALVDGVHEKLAPPRRILGYEVR